MGNLTSFVFIPSTQVTSEIRGSRLSVHCHQPISLSFSPLVAKCGKTRGETQGGNSRFCIKTLPNSPAAGFKIVEKQGGGNSRGEKTHYDKDMG